MNLLSLRHLSLAALALLLAGCPRGSGTVDDDDDDLTGVDDDDSGSDDDDDATTPPPPETDCEDGLDNDEDGLTDCDDDDCAAVWRCTWPETLSHEGSFDYEPSTLAEIAGYDECITAFTVPLSEVTTAADQCGTCDRTFSGPMTYTQDNCPMDDGPRPTSVSYGIVFFTTTQRDIYSKDDAGAWQLVGSATATAEGEPFVLSRTDEVDVDGNDGGDITTTLSFTDPQ